MPWELRSCDNRDPATGLGSLLERSVDVIITDPPYNPKVHACSLTRRCASKDAGHRPPPCSVD
jgi:DNA modification methylase